MQFHGILHNHSACSKEGCYPLADLRQRWAGQLSFAAMTEHAERTTAEAYADYVQECDRLSDEHFRFIPGLEVATTSGDMLLLGCRKFICTTDPFRVLREARETEDCLILLAHPEEGKMISAVLERADGFEGWNGGHMGGLMPPLDWFMSWRRQRIPGKLMTGGNDIHKIDPRRKIVTLVESPTQSEHDLLSALRQGQFITSNGLFAFTPSGHAFFQRNTHTPISGRLSFALLARCLRLVWRSINYSFEAGASVLALLGINKQQRTRLNRVLRQYL